MNIENPDQLVRYLRRRDLLTSEERPEISILAGGVSNRTVLVRRASGEDLVLKQALNKLRVATEWYSDPKRIHREAEGMRVLQELLPAGAVPAFVFEDFEEHIVAMAAVPSPHTVWKESLLQARIDKNLVAQFGRILALIHTSFNVEAYPESGMLRSIDFFQSLRLDPYYGFAAKQEPVAERFLHRLIDETRKIKLSLVHGDYSPKNILVYRGRIVLLDHEVIHVGDPAFDVGFAMTHLLSKANHLSDHRSTFARAARNFWTTYRGESSSGDAGLEDRSVRHTLGCLLARIVGRSPLEYLSRSAADRQKMAAINLIEEMPESMPMLIKRFIEEIDRWPS